MSEAPRKTPPRKFMEGSGTFELFRHFIAFGTFRFTFARISCGCSGRFEFEFFEKKIGISLNNADNDWISQ